MSDKNKKLFDFIEEILTKDEPSPETKNNLKRKIALSEILSKEDDEQKTNDCTPTLDSDLDSDLPSDLEVGKSDVELKELLQIEDFPHSDNDKLDERIDDIKLDDIKLDDVKLDDVKLDDIEVDTETETAETIKEYRENVEALQYDEEKAPSIMIVARNLNDEHKDDPTLKNLEIKDVCHEENLNIEESADLCLKNTLEESCASLDTSKEDPRLTQDFAVQTYKNKINQRQKQQTKPKVKSNKGDVIANTVICLIALVFCGYSFIYF